jgi:hypothetical protein
VGSVVDSGYWVRWRPARTKDYELVSELSLALVYRSRKKMQLNEVERCS